MIDSYGFLKLTIDSLSEQIVVMDSTGLIRFVNQAWIEFGQENGCVTPVAWDDVNYLRVCEAAAATGDGFGVSAFHGIRRLMADGCGTFTLEYPCHGPNVLRWFMMTVKHFRHLDENFYLVTHRDITKRKQAEEAVSQLARLDGLTNIPNRRAFNDFLDSEWSRSIRQGLPLSLALIDIDHFKLVNDTYGHQRGDECLERVAEVLTAHRKRPSDFFARYGGEEFVYVFGGSTSEDVHLVVQQLLSSIRELALPNAKSPVDRFVTASAGLATLHPKAGLKPNALIEAADALLYEAKSLGRNQLAWNSANHPLAVTPPKANLPIEARH